MRFFRQFLVLVLLYYSSDSSIDTQTLRPPQCFSVTPVTVAEADRPFGSEVLGEGWVLLGFA